MGNIERRYSEVGSSDRSFCLEKTHVSVLAFCFALALTSVVDERAVMAQESVSGDVVLDSAGIFLKTDNGFFGQGYLVLDEVVGEEKLRIYTIGHVISEARAHIFVTVPGVKDGAKVNKSDFFCVEEDFSLDLSLKNEEIGDLGGDSACFYEFTEKSSKRILNNDNLKPFVRLREHEELKVGAYIAFPKAYGKSFSLMRIIEIDDVYLTVEAVREVSDVGEDFYYGTICNGRSGGPAILVSLLDDVDISSFKPVMSDGLNVVVGEIEMGMKGEGFDDPETGLECFIKGKIRRPMK